MVTQQTLRVTITSPVGQMSQEPTALQPAVRHVATGVTFLEHCYMNLDISLACRTARA